MAAYDKDTPNTFIPKSYSTVEDNAAKNAAMSPAARAAFEASKASWTKDQDPYYTAIVPGTGLTQAQIDVREQNKQITADVKGVYDATTGRVYPEGTSQEAIDELNAAEKAEKDANAVTVDSPEVKAAKAAAKASEDLVLKLQAELKKLQDDAATTAAKVKTDAEKAAEEAKIAAAKAAADKAAADKAAADKAAADAKAAADKAAKDAADTKAAKIDANRDAFAALQDLFASYGLDSLAGEIQGYLSSGLTASEALIKLKTNPNGAYAARFAGNFARQKAGLNVMSEAAYIELENSYANTLKAYGLGNMLSTDPKQNWKQFATYIANDINAPEFKDRIATVEDRVINADPSTKELFQKWYPNLTDKDLISYFLNPTETLPKLKEKVTSAEIGSAFLAQGLASTQASATELAKYGIDRAGAIAGAKDIADVLPQSEKFSNIYGEQGIKYNQKTGEEEFLKSNAQAAESRRRLKSLERASFSGDAGVSAQAGSLQKNTQGIF